MANEPQDTTGTDLPGGLVVSKEESTVQDKVPTPGTSDASDAPGDSPTYGPDDAIRITTLAGTTRTLDYRPGWTATQYLQAAGIKVSANNTIAVASGNTSPDAALQPKDVIIVTGNIDNG